MATYINGIWGNYSGKIGTLVFYTLNGKQVTRSIGKSTKPPTEKQLQNQMELRVVIAFLKPILSVINSGFAAMAKGTGKSPHNIAVSYNKKQAVAGAYPDVEMDYARVLVSQGKLPEVHDAEVEPATEGLSFTWDCPADLRWPRQTDQVMLLAYFPTTGEAIYELGGPKRSAGSAMLAIPANLLDAYMEVYMAFVAQDRKGISNSVYLGSFNK